MVLVTRLKEYPSMQPIAQLTARVAEHRLFSELRAVSSVRLFMEHHVWAVWDFMTLLKSLQAELAPVTLPWRPADAASARLINEIVLGEESDRGPDGRPASHFEIYVAAMEAAGADTGPIRRFLDLLARGLGAVPALDEVRAPEGARRFVRSTLALVEMSLPERLAAFTIGREDIIPTMFRRIVCGLGDGTPGCDFSGLIWYLDRHVAVDAEEHGPMAARLFQRICLDPPAAREPSLAAAEAALRHRLALWDAVLAAIEGDGRRSAV